MAPPRTPTRILLLAALVAGGVLGARLLPAREADVTTLTRGFTSASTPSSSFDGRRFLFAGRREEDGASGIWEIGSDGSRARIVTTGDGDPRDPIYLPDGRVLYSGVVARPGAGLTAPRALFSIPADGGDPTRLTFGDHRDGSPRLLADGRVLFERRPGSIDRADPPADPVWMTIHPDGTLIARYPGDPPAPAGAALRTARFRPPMLTSVVSAGRATGTLLCLNVRESRLSEVASLPAGAIRSVRVSRAEGASAGEALGEAPVHPDGSFYVEVPADLALALTLLDGSGRAVASLGSGIWVRPNENRGCVGCHEPPDLAPENVRPLAVDAPPHSLASRAPTSGVAHVR